MEHYIKKKTSAQPPPPSISLYLLLQPPKTYRTKKQKDQETPTTTLGFKRILSAISLLIQSTIYRGQPPLAGKVPWPRATD